MKVTRELLLLLFCCQKSIFALFSNAVCVPLGSLITLTASFKENDLVSVRKKGTFFCLEKIKGNWAKNATEILHNDCILPWFHIETMRWGLPSGFSSRCPKNCKISWFQLFYSTTNLAQFSSFFQLKTNLGFLKIRHEACSWDIEFLVFPFHFWEESFDEMFTLLVKFESTIIEQRSSNSIAAAATEQLLPSKVEEREWKWGGGNSCFLTPLEAVVVESPYFFVFREEQQHPQKNYKDSSSRQEIFKNWYFTVCTLLHSQTYRQRNNLGNGFYVLVMVKVVTVNVGHINFVVKLIWSFYYYT